MVQLPLDPAAAVLILASTSPRRRELLTQAGLPFLCISPGPDGGVDESAWPQEVVEHYVERLARAKAIAGLGEVRRLGLPALPVLGADTAVSVDGEILGKPADEAEACAMLRKLSGRAHQVLTGLCLLDGNRAVAAISVSTVHFRVLSEPDILDYVSSGEAFDKAGAYGIQGRAALMVHHLEGSHSGVMGLPLYELGELLRALPDAQPDPA